MASNSLNLFSTTGVEIRDTAVHTSTVFQHGESGHVGALITLDSSLDQSCAVALQGKQADDTDWQSIESCTVAAGSNDSLRVGEPWGQIRLSAQCSVVPGSGVLYARLSAGSVNAIVGTVTADISSDPTRDLGKVDIAGFDVSLPAGEAHIGEVGGNAITKVVQLTVTLPAYVAGDCVGGVTEVTTAARVSGGSLVLHSLTLWDVDGQKEPYNLYVFTANPASSTFTDADPVVVHADDRAKLAPGFPIRIYAGDYIAAQSGGSGAARQNVGGSIVAAATSIWVVLEAVETPDYASTGALTLILGVLRD